MSNTAENAEQETQKDNKASGCMTILFPGVFLVAGLAVMFFVVCMKTSWVASGLGMVMAIMMCVVM